MMELIDPVNASVVQNASLKTANKANPNVVSNAPAFMALRLPDSIHKTITVRIGNHTAEIHNGADTATIESVLSGMARL